MSKQARSFIDLMPPNPVNEPLSSKDLEYLTDQILNENDMSASEALMVLMDEVLRVYFSDLPCDLENVTGIVSRHAYYRLAITDKLEQALFTEARAAMVQR